MEKMSVTRCVIVEWGSVNEYPRDMICLTLKRRGIELYYGGARSFSEGSKEVGTACF